MANNKQDLRAARRRPAHRRRLRHYQPFELVRSVAIQAIAAADAIDALALAFPEQADRLYPLADALHEAAQLLQRRVGFQWPWT